MTEEEIIFEEVALRKESVDRNIVSVVAYSYYNRVALRKESVDRNKDGDKPFQTLSGSLSARRAWIEIYGNLFAVYHR